MNARQKEVALVSILILFIIGYLIGGVLFKNRIGVSGEGGGFHVKCKIYINNLSHIYLPQFLVTCDIGDTQKISLFPVITDI